MIELISTDILKSLSNDELLISTAQAVRAEKSAITNVTRHFQEVFERQLYLPTYSSMFEMLKEQYGYCDGSAQIRIATLRLIKEVPLAKEKLEDGQLSMSVAANIQSFLYSERKQQKPYSLEEKIELVNACTGKSKFEAQKEFAKRNPEFEKRDSVRPISESKVRIETTISIEALQKLNELRDVLSHVKPSMTFGDLIARLAEDGLEKYSPLRKAERAKRRLERRALEEKVLGEVRTRVPTSSGEVESDEPIASVVSVESDTSVESKAEIRDAARSRYVSAHEKHQVPNDGLGCTYVDKISGRRCCSKRFLQLDHVTPFSEGGTSSAANLRWLCGQHNRARYRLRL